MNKINYSELIINENRINLISDLQNFNKNKYNPIVISTKNYTTMLNGIYKQIIEEIEEF
jgi:hypothetical protein